MSIITLHTVSFSNMFSYGEDNVLHLDKNKITQLTAPNGSGKSSIALIIQELLFNKNIKGVKKGDVLNRWSKAKSWKGKLDFSVDSDSYEVEVTRTGASTKVALKHNGVDISEHKVLDTYKKITEILGADFDVISQLTYQSSTDLLDFLKATDSNRKKFLINLFNLGKYLEIGEKIKAKASETDKNVNMLNGELKSIEDFLNYTTVPEYKIEKTLVSVDASISVRLAEINKELANITEISKRIDKNNMYINERESLDFDVSLTAPEPFTKKEEIDVLKHDKIALSTELSKLRSELKGIKILDKCPSCGQAIDNNHLISMKTNLEAKIAQKEIDFNTVNSSLETMLAELDVYNKALTKFNNNKQSIERFEQLTQLIDPSVPVTYPNASALMSEKQELQTILNKQEAEQRAVIDYNKQISAHNAKIEAIKEQINDFKVRQTSVKQDILDKSSVATSLTILKKAFSPSGIVAFKLESLTKELEETINRYLASLSDGQFQVEFSLDKEKLNISIINNGVKAPIETMSGGEFSRIQTAVLLAIRSLLSKLGGSSINLLFLDEITGVLDDEGKDKLVEVLQEEEGLNVFLISHDFTHPLINKINIIKKKNVSSISS